MLPDENDETFYKLHFKKWKNNAYLFPQVILK